MKRWRHLLTMVAPVAATMLNSTTLAAPPTDYTVTGLTATTIMSVGGVIQATDTTCLTQIDPSRPVIYNSLHLSTDSTVTLGDMRVATHRVDTQSNSCSTGRFWAKPNLPVGTYYARSFADYRNTAVESNKDNNGSPLQIIEVVADGQADITVELVDFPAEVTPGQTISVSINVCNIGPKPTGDFRTSLYLSTDPYIGSRGLLLGSIQQNLYNEHCSNPNVKLWSQPLPNDLIVGDVYYFELISDIDNNISESNEGNNSTVGVPFTVISATNDLVFSSFEGPTVGIRGTSVPIKAEVCDFVSGEVSGQFGSLQLFKDGVDSSAINIGWFYNSPGITPCTTNIFSYAPIPATLAPGTYVWRATLDIMNMVQEVDKSNNTITGNAIVIQ